jgi:hypothetical protein
VANIQSGSFKIAEYRAPEFVVTLKPDSAIYFAGDIVGVGIEGRYLFDAPMRRAIVRWTAEVVPDYSSELPVPEGWSVGGWVYWARGAPTPAVKLSGIDTLDGDGPRAHSNFQHRPRSRPSPSVSPRSSCGRGSHESDGIGRDPLRNHVFGTRVRCGACGHFLASG